MCVLLLAATLLMAPTAFSPPEPGPFGSVWRSLSLLVVLLCAPAAVLAGFGAWGAYQGRRWAAAIAWFFAAAATVGLVGYVADMLQL